MSDLFTLVDEYLNDLRCEFCGKRVYGDVCTCQRDAYYRVASGEVDTWLSENLPEGEDLTPEERRLRKMMLSSAGQALGRSRHRAAMQYRQFDGYPQTMDQEERTGFRIQHGDVNVKWHPPVTKWTPRADQEPI